MTLNNPSMKRTNMSSILIHPDFQKGSSLCPVCNDKKSEIRRDNLKLCFDCNKAAVKQNPKSEMKLNAIINCLVRNVLLLTLRITVILFYIGYGIRNFFRVIRNSVYKGFSK